MKELTVYMLESHSDESGGSDNWWGAYPSEEVIRHLYPHLFDKDGNIEPGFEVKEITVYGEDNRHLQHFVMIDDEMMEQLRQVMKENGQFTENITDTMLLLNAIHLIRNMGQALESRANDYWEMRAERDAALGVKG